MSFIISTHTNLQELQQTYEDIFTLYQSHYELLLAKLTLLASHPESYQESDISDIEAVIKNAYWKQETIFRFNTISLQSVKNSKYLSFCCYRSPEELTLTTKKTSVACFVNNQLSHSSCPQDNSKPILEITLRNSLHQTSPTIYKISNLLNNHISLHSSLSVLDKVPTYAVNYNLPKDTWKDCQLVYLQLDGTKQTFTIPVGSLSLGLTWLLMTPQTIDEIQWNSFIIKNAIRSIESNRVALEQSQTVITW